MLRLTELKNGLEVSSFSHVGRVRIGDLNVTILPKLKAASLLRLLRYAYGFGVVPPLIDDDLISMGRINDSLLYGGIANITVETTDEICADVAPRVVAEACGAYGRPFIEIYEDAGRDFYEIPIDLHSPAEVHINNLTTGRTFSAGHINYDVLEASFFG